MPDKYRIIPQVDQPSEFLEIAKDFTNPLEAVREAISNAFDAGAKLIQIKFLVESLHGEGALVVIFQDNGAGMDKCGLQSFFDLGNSLNRCNINAIGAKGHGTKVYLGCEKLIVESVGPDRVPRRAVMENPLASLYASRIPEVEVEEKVHLDITIGTRITLRGFNRNRRDIFTHDQLRDYVLWYTKFGSFESEFGITENKTRRLLLQGVDRSESEEISFGHVFAEETPDSAALFDSYLTDAPKHFARKWVRTGKLRNHPEISYQAVLAIEGDSAKRRYNTMLSGPGRGRKPGMYKVTDRYGLYLAKDYIPIEKTTGWLGTRSTDHLMYHAFVNCQGFQLTANRGSVSNTPQPILEDIRKVVDEIRQEIIESDEYDAMAYLQEEAAGHETITKEEKQYKKRVENAARQPAFEYKGNRLVAPRQESGVFGLIMQLVTIDSELFPFDIVDYDTTIGIDALAKTRDRVPLVDTELRYLELKYILDRRLNHSFKYLSWIVAWDLPLCANISETLPPQ